MKIFKLILLASVVAAMYGAREAGAQQTSFFGEPAALTMRSVEFDDGVYQDWLSARKQPRYSEKSAGVHLNCSEQPGAKMCLRAQQLQDTIFGSCSGEYCTMLWNKGSSYLREITNAYEDISIASADKEIGGLVQSAVKEICRSELTAGGLDSQYAMRNLVMNLNLAMPVFVDIQKKAGIEKPAKCKMEVQ